MDVQSTMSPETYTGIIDGIEVFWTQRAIQNLPKNAQIYEVDMKVLKCTTEKVAVACARRIGKKTVHILYEVTFNRHIHGVC